MWRKWLATTMLDLRHSQSRNIASMNWTFRTSRSTSMRTAPLICGNTIANTAVKPNCWIALMFLKSQKLLRLIKAKILAQSCLTGRYKRCCFTICKIPRVSNHSIMSCSTCQTVRTMSTSNLVWAYRSQNLK